MIVATDAVSSKKNCSSETSAEVLASPGDGPSGSWLVGLAGCHYSDSYLPSCLDDSRSSTRMLAQLGLTFRWTITIAPPPLPCFSVVSAVESGSSKVVAVDLGDIRYRLGDGLIVGYLRFKPGNVRGICELIRNHTPV